MLLAAILTFLVLLNLGFPIFIVVLASTAIGVVLFGGSNPIILVQQLFNGLDRFIILAVPFFIMAGSVAAQGDISRRIVNVMNVLFGRVRGGLGMATVFACAFFSTITGSSMATVVAIGTIMLPSLISHGYPKRMAIGIITCSGTLGVLIPPSIPMVILCVAMETSIGSQFLAGFLPGLLISSVFCLYIWIVSTINKIGEVQKYSFRESLKILKDSIFALLFPVLVLGGIYGGFTTPTEAAAVSLVYVLIIELCVYKKIKVKDLTRLLSTAAVTSGTLTIILACAIAFIWFMTVEQIPGMLTELVTEVIASKSLLLLYLILIFLFVGFFMNVISVVLILGPMLLPTLNYFDVNLIHFGVLAVVMSEVGFVTPPFGLCLFVAIQISQESMKEVVRSSLPFLILLFLMAVILAFVPQLSIFLPNLFYGR